MTVSKHDIDQMSNFMRALNVENTSSASLREPEGARADTRAPVRSDSRATYEMKTILERFHAAAGDAVGKLNEDATYDRDLREALVTERTVHGSRIGNWEIRVREDGSRKFYDVVQIDGSVCIASDLLLYEAAHGLVRILNSGGKVNSYETINLLRAEQDYASALNDAVLYKHY